MLIGSDYYWELMNGEAPVTVSTRLGWVLSGPRLTQPRGMDTPVVSHVAMQTMMAEPESPSNRELTDQIQAFWELESLGIGKCDKLVHDKFKEFHDPLPDNYTLSLKRLQGLSDRRQCS